MNGTSKAKVASDVMESIRGATMAQKVIFDARGGHAHPDALFEAIKAAGDGERLKGIARAVQKALEGRA